MLVLFPFEEKFYREAGVPVTFVGHPVVERVARTVDDALFRRVLEEAGMDRSAPTLAVLPGSRRGEVEKMLPAMLHGAKLLAERFPGLQFLVSRAPSLPEEWFSKTVHREEVGNLLIHAGDFPEILRGCVAGVAASGTATLEAAMTGLPMVVVYRMNRLSHLLGRMLVRVDHVAMPNLVAGERVLPELIQGDCNGPAIAAALAPWLESRPARERVRVALGGIRRKLGGEDAYARAARAVLNHWTP